MATRSKTYNLWTLKPDGWMDRKIAEGITGYEAAAEQAHREADDRLCDVLILNTDPDAEDSVVVYPGDDQEWDEA